MQLTYSILLFAFSGSSDTSHDVYLRVDFTTVTVVDPKPII